MFFARLEALEEAQVRRAERAEQEQVVQP